MGACLSIPISVGIILREWDRGVFGVSGTPWNESEIVSWGHLTYQREFQGLSEERVERIGGHFMGFDGPDVVRSGANERMSNLQIDLK